MFDPRLVGHAPRRSTEPGPVEDLDEGRAGSVLLTDARTRVARSTSIRCRPKYARALTENSIRQLSKHSGCEDAEERYAVLYDFVHHNLGSSTLANAGSAASTLTIVDDDLLDTPSHVRRIFGAAMADLNATSPPPKVDLVGRHLEMIGMDTTIHRVKGDVRSEEVLRRLVDADVVICATDTHGSRTAMLTGGPRLAPATDPR